MTGEETSLRLEIGHLWLIDLVGYSKLLIEGQKGAAASPHPWLLVQVTTQISPLFHLAGSVMRRIVVAAAIGFPPCSRLDRILISPVETGFKRSHSCEFLL